MISTNPKCREVIRQCRTSAMVLANPTTGKIFLAWLGGRTPNEEVTKAIAAGFSTSPGVLGLLSDGSVIVEVDDPSNESRLLLHAALKDFKLALALSAVAPSA